MKVRILFLFICFVILCSLGVWQLKRLSEKKLLEEYFNSNPDSLIFNKKVYQFSERDLYKKISLDGSYTGRPIYYYTINEQQNGYEVLQPFITNYGQYFLVNRGFIKDKLVDNFAENKKIHLIGHLINLPRKKPLGISNDLKNNVWFYFNHKDLYQFYRIKNFLPVLILPIDKTQFIGKKISLKSKIILRNDHLQYALTWFSLAIAVLIIGFIYYKKNSKRGL